MKVKEFLNPFIFVLLVGTCCKSLMTWFFFKTYQIMVFFQKITIYVTKLNFIGRNAKNCPKKLKSMYLCERLNLYQLIMQTTFATNVSHIKFQNENYIITSNKKTSSKYIVGYIPKCFDTCHQPQDPMSKHLND
jgi:hypothetical protein